jgi:hypothetical protein
MDNGATLGPMLTLAQNRTIGEAVKGKEPEVGQWILKYSNTIFC